MDWARRNRAAKRGGGAQQVTLEEIAQRAVHSPEELIALDEALTSLAEVDERKARIVELRFFGGMTLDETSKSMGISTATVERETRVAQMWLYRRMNGDGSA